MISVIPMPHKAHLTEKCVYIPASVRTDIYPNAAVTLCDFVKKMYNVETGEGDGFIFEKKSDMQPEEYSVKISDGQAVIASCDEAGAQNGVSTLIQLMEVRDGKIYLPAGDIQDCPDCSWRGVMIDLARSWHSVGIIEQYIDMCRFYKLRHIHLHFTDNESYTLPCAKYPRLTTAGKSYTGEEIDRIKAYARLRGVDIIPEIDVPGHCTQFVEAYGDIFGTYGGVISLTDTSLRAMEDIFSELCNRFPDSKYVHIGGDEAAILRWEEDEETMGAFRRRGVDIDGMETTERSQYMYAYFIARICDIVTKCGKTPVVWEGFGKSVNRMIPKNVVVLSWENYYQTTPSLLEAGFRLVNAAWVPMYIVAPIFAKPLAECYEWDVYSFGAVHPESPCLNEKLHIEPTAQIEGAQLQAWGDHITKVYQNISDGIREEQTLIEERVSALSENTWNIKKVSDFEEFSSRAEAVSKKYLSLRGESRA